MRRYITESTRLLRHEIKSSKSQLKKNKERETGDETTLDESKESKHNQNCKQTPSTSLIKPGKLCHGKLEGPCL